MNLFLGRRNLWIILAVLFSVALFSVLAAHAYVGLFSRFISDDYCRAGVLRSQGFFGAQKNWYTTWSGRFSFYLAISIAHVLGGAKLAPFLPGIFLASWLIALTWALSQFMRIVSPAAPFIVPLLLAEVIINGTLVASPSIYQSLYWQTGAITYTLPLIFSAVYVGVVLRSLAVDSTPTWMAFVGAFLTFAAGGFSETYAALQMSALFVAMVPCFKSHAKSCKRARSVLIGGLVGSILSAIILLVAPGNEERVEASVVQAVTAAPRSFLSFLELSAGFGTHSVQYSIGASRLTMALVFVVPALIALNLPNRAPRSGDQTSISFDRLQTLVLLPVVAWLLIVASLVPTAYVAAYVRGGYHPQPRLLITSHFVFFSLACCWSYLVGNTLLRNRLTIAFIQSRYFAAFSVIFAILLLLSPIITAQRTLLIKPTVQRYASLWDRQDRDIRAAKLRGATQVTVQHVPGTSQDSRGNLFFDLRLMDSTPGNWVTGCAAEYYGLDSIVLE